MAAVKPRTYPAKRAPSARKVARPRELQVQVDHKAGTWTAVAAKKSAASTTSAANAVRRLALTLGYSVFSDVRYVGTRIEDASLTFLIIEVQP